MKTRFLYSAILLFVTTIQSYAVIRYVKPIATGTGDGSTWANASADLQAIINLSTNNDQVWLAAGVYRPEKDETGNATPTDARTKLFLMKDGVAIYGGFAGTETLLSQRNFVINKTILSGDIDQNDTNTDGNFIAEVSANIQGSNAYHVLVSVADGSNSILDGLVITAGRANGVSTQTIEGRYIYQNSGAGINTDITDLTINNCVFSGNWCSDSGGAFNNSISTLTFTNCVFTGNTSDYNGGVMSARGNLTTFTNCLMVQNTAYYGAVIEANGGSPINLINSTIAANTSTNGAVYLSQSAILSNKNSIIYGNIGGGIILTQSATSTSSYSIVQNSGGSLNWTGVGTDGGNNFDKNPFFFNESDIDGADNQYFTNDDGFNISSCSFALNTGSNAFAPANDIAGNIRPYNSGIADMGAYEFQANATLPLSPTAVSASSNAINCSQSVTLNATCATGTINWSNSLGAAVGTGTGLVVMPLVNTTYYAECAASPSCVSFKTNTGLITVTQRPNPTNITASTNTPICSGTSVTLTATCAIGTPNWYSNSTTSSFAGGTYTTFFYSTQTYTVKCIDGTCQSLAENAPTITVLSYPASIQYSSNYICMGQSITLTSSCATGTLSWYASATGTTVLGTGNTIAVTPSASGRYYAACSMVGCVSSRTQSSTITVNPTPASPTSVSVNKTIICPSTNVSLSATCATGTVTWYNVSTGGTALGTGGTLIQTPIIATTYYAACKLASCENTRVATSQVLVATIGSNLNLTTNISGTSVQASTNTITATNTILTGANVKYLANNSITLNPQSGGGFNVTGAVFEAKIQALTGCN